MKTSDIEVTLLDCMGSDLSVVNAARVSFDKESEWENEVAFWDAEPVLKEADAKLIRFLAHHKHTSPFNHTFLTFRVKAPIFVARQLVKHKFMPWNEVSRRYVDSEPEFYMPEMWRQRAENVKQGSREDAAIWKMRHTDPNTGESWFSEVGDSVALYTENCLRMYKEMMAAGVAPELARSVLPQSTMTEWIWSGSLGAYADMLKLRLDPHAQYESRIVAQKIKAEVEKLFPISVKALLDND